MTKRKDKLKTKIDQLQEQLKTIERREKAEQRKQETKKKILIGAMLQTWIKQGRFSEADLLKGLDSFLVRASERSLFGLEPKQKPAGQSTTPQPNPKDSEKVPPPPSPAQQSIASQSIMQSTQPKQKPEDSTTPRPRTRLQEVDEKKLAEEFL